MFISTSVPFEQLRIHLRHLLIATTPAGDKRVFRFYDPRVLPVFLQASRPLDLSELLRIDRGLSHGVRESGASGSFRRGASVLNRYVAELMVKGDT